MEKYELPFRVLRANRCSFLVSFPDGQIAFISNTCFHAFLENPKIEYRIVEDHDRHNNLMYWVETVSFTRGIKIPVSKSY